VHAICNLLTQVTLDVQVHDSSSYSPNQHFAEVTKIS
jgi:hypothetical protein